MIPTAAMTLDFTSISVAAIGGLLTIVGAVATALINSRMKDKAAAATLAAAAQNALGAMKQAADGLVVNLHPTLTLPALAGVPAALVPGVQYMLDHAGAEADRFGLTPAALADKVNAQWGLDKIAKATAAIAPTLSIAAASTAGAGIAPPARVV